MALQFPLRGPVAGPIRARTGPARGGSARPGGLRLRSGPVLPGRLRQQGPPIGREGGVGPTGFPNRPIPPRPPGIRFGPPPGGGPVRFPLPPRNPGNPYGGNGGTDIVRGGPYQRDLRQGINQQQYQNLLHGRLPGMEHGDFVGLTRQQRIDLAGGLHQLPGGQWTSAPIYPGLGGGRPPFPIQPIGPEPVLPHPVDQMLPANHGLHPAQLQMLRDQFDNALLSSVAAQAQGPGGGLY